MSYGRKEQLCGSPPMSETLTREDVEKIRIRALGAAPVLFHRLRLDKVFAAALKGLEAAKPCVYEARPFPGGSIRDEVRRSYCRTHGFDCPNTPQPERKETFPRIDEYAIIEPPWPEHDMPSVAAEPSPPDDWKCPACGKSSANCLGHSEPERKEVMPDSEETRLRPHVTQPPRETTSDTYTVPGPYAPLVNEPVAAEPSPSPDVDGVIERLRDMAPDGALAHSQDHTTVKAWYWNDICRLRDEAASLLARMRDELDEALEAEAEGFRLYTGAQEELARIRDERDAQIKARIVAEHHELEYRNLSEEFKAERDSLRSQLEASQAEVRRLREALDEMDDLLTKALTVKSRAALRGKA